MTEIILQRPHPLDPLWYGLPEHVQEAWNACEAAAPCPDEKMDQLVSEAYRRLHAMLALPSRNISDVLVKIDALMDSNDECEPIRGGIEALRKVHDELLEVLNAGLAAGAAYESGMTTACERRAA